MGTLSDYYINREGGQSGTEQQTGTPQAGAPVDLSPLASEVATQAANYGISHTSLPSIPGVGGAVGGAANSALHGGTAEQIGQSAVSGGITSLLQHTLPNLPALPSIIGAASAEMLTEDPQPALAATKAGVSALGAAAGSLIPVPVLGPMIGSAVANHFGNKSLEDGYLGDWNDVRSREKERDAVEGSGFSVGDTKDMAAMDAIMGGYEREDGYGFGLTANYGATTEGKYDKALGSDPFGVQKEVETLSSYYNDRAETITSSEDKTDKESSIDRTDGSNDHDNDPSGSGDFGDRESEPGGMGGV